jgi:peptide/nickel transport system substrate-binding protein
MKTTPLRAAAAAGLALTLTLAGCAAASPTPSADEELSLTVASQVPASSMDPVDAGGAQMPYFQAVYDTLVHRDPDGTLTPWLATEWSYDQARTALTLTLRDDVTFDDGSALDAAAVKANLERFKAGGGSEAVKASTTESVEAPDATTVVIHLSAPDPALLDSLSDAYGLVANPAVFGDDEPLATVPDGTGPYTIDQSQTIVGSKWVFDRRDDYWGEELPYDTITYLVLEDENAIINGLKTGQVDAATIQGSIAQLEGDSTITLTPQEIDLKLFNLFDRKGEKIPALADERVRQAINYAVDRQTMVDQILDGRGTPTSQMWSPDAPGFVEDLDDHYPYDPEKAKELMAEAGYAGGFAISLARLPGLVDDALAEALRTNLAAIGITLTWEDTDQTTFVQRTFYQKEFPGVVMNGGQSVIDWSIYLSVIAPSPVSNPEGVTDAEITEAASGIQSGTEADAVAAAQRMNERVVDLAWFVPLFRMQYEHATVSGVTVTPQVGLAVPAIYNYAPAE